MCDDTLNDAAFVPNLINSEMYLSSTNWICSPRLEHIFTKRSMAMAVRVDLLLTSSAVSCTRMPPPITVFIHRVIPLNEYPFSNPFGGCWQGKAPPKIAVIGHFIGNPKERFDTVFSLGLFH